MVVIKINGLEALFVPQGSQVKNQVVRYIQIF